jgi:hypothetical protein
MLSPSQLMQAILNSGRRSGVCVPCAVFEFVIVFLKDKPPSGICSPDGFATVGPDMGKSSGERTVIGLRDAATKLAH